MAETLTEEQGRETFLKELTNLNDFGGFKRESPSESSASEPTSKQQSSEQPSPTAEDRGKPEEAEVKTSQPEPKETVDTTAASTRTDADKTKSDHVPYSRFSEVVSDRNNWKAKYEEAVKAKSEAPKTEEKPQAPDTDIADIPPKPQYELKDLKSALTQYEDKIEDFRLEGNVEKVKECRNLIKVLKDEIEKTSDWQSKYQEAVNRHHGIKSYLTQEIVKKYPDLTNPESEIAKTFTGMKTKVSEHLPRMLKEPKAEWFLAQASDWYLKSLRVDAAQQEITKLKEEVQRLQKAQLPITTNGVSRVGESSNTHEQSLQEGRSAIMEQIRKINSGSGRRR